MKIIFCFCFVCLVFFACETPDKVTINPDDIPDDSLSINYLTLQLRKEPRNAGLFSLRAQLFLENNQLVDAIRDAEVALHLDSLNSIYYLQLSNYYLVNGQSENAKKVLEKCIKNLPNYAPGYVALAKMYFYVQDYNNAMLYLKEAESIDVHLAQTFFVRALVYYETNRKNSAINQLHKSIEKDPQSYDSYVLLGLLLAERSDSLAIQYYETAARLRPDLIEPHYNIAMFYQDNNNPQQAINKYEYILNKYDNNHVYAKYNIAYVYLEFFNNPEKAKEFFQEVLLINPNYVEAELNIGVCLERMRRFNEAREQYKRILSKHTNYALAIEGLNRLDKLQKLK